MIKVIKSIVTRLKILKSLQIVTDHSWFFSLSFLCQSRNIFTIKVSKQQAAVICSESMCKAVVLVHLYSSKVEVVYEDTTSIHYLYLHQYTLIKARSIYHSIVRVQLNLVRCKVSTVIPLLACYVGKLHQTIASGTESSFRSSVTGANKNEK